VTLHVHRQAVLNHAHSGDYSAAVTNPSHDKYTRPSLRETEPAVAVLQHSMLSHVGRVAVMALFARPGRTRRGS